MSLLSHSLLLAAACQRLALIELDVDVRHALLDLGRATLSARPPAAEVRVRALVGGSTAHVERVDVDARVLLLRVGERAREQLLHERRAGLVGEVEDLQSLACVPSPDQVHDHARFARTDPLIIGFSVADHSDSFSVRLVDPPEATLVVSDSLEPGAAT